MLVTCGGMLIAVREEQRAKAAPPMLRTESGSLTAVIEEQSLKAHAPMVDTEAGMGTETERTRGGLAR